MRAIRSAYSPRSGMRPLFGSAPAVAGGPSSPITASLVATRVTGTAPLGVIFDATGTTHTDLSNERAFDRLTYAFDFDDVGSGNYTVTGLPKNTQSGGPLAAHVFETPGTYDVVVTVTDEDDNEDTATVQVVVANADTVYSGTNTIVVSPTSDFSGAPSGAEQRTTLPSDYNGKRVLLNRGESFGAITIALDDASVQIGAYGTGADPVVASITVGPEGAVSVATISATYAHDGTDNEFITLTGAQLITDVQDMVDNPSNNHGWTLRVNGSNKLFDLASSAGGDLRRPRLALTWTV